MRLRPAVVSHPRGTLENMATSAPLTNPAGTHGGPPHAHVGALYFRSGRVYVWRRLLALAVVVGVLWSGWWLGALVGGHLVAPAVGTAPVPVAEGAPQAGA